MPSRVRLVAWRLNHARADSISPWSKRSVFFFAAFAGARDMCALLSLRVSHAIKYTRENADVRRNRGSVARKQILTVRRNYENYGNHHFRNLPPIQTMKLPLLLTLLAVVIWFYLHNSVSAGKTTAASPARNTASASNVIIVAASPSYYRWKTGPNAQTDLKTGPNAQTDLKTGPNAQTDFEPFAPN